MPFRHTRVRQSRTEEILPMIVAAILGLVVPGYALARAWRAPPVLAAASAFPLSALLIAVAVVAYALVGVCICFFTMLAAIGTVTLLSGICWAVDRRKNSPPTNADGVVAAAPTWLWVWTIAQVALVLSGLLLRTSLYPLAGLDTPYRWEGLARLMLAEESLSFYPPVTAEDFTKYPYPDGIPPLVSGVYWWLYAGWGGPCPRSTSLVILLQAGSCLALVYFAARACFGTAGGLLSVLALSTSVLFFVGIAIGQETGYTALSVAGQLASRWHCSVIVAGAWLSWQACLRAWECWRESMGRYWQCAAWQPWRSTLVHVVSCHCSASWPPRAAHRGTFAIG